MKKIAIIAGVVLFSTSLFSCGGSSSCVSSEKYMPEYFNLDNNLVDTSEWGDVAELETELSD